MGPENMFSGVWWIFPFIMCIIVVVIFSRLAGGRGCRLPWMGNSDQNSERNESETSLEILKKRYAKGEINRDEFEQMKRDILS